MKPAARAATNKESVCAKTHGSISGITQHNISNTGSNTRKCEHYNEFLLIFLIYTFDRKFKLISIKNSHKFH